MVARPMSPPDRIDGPPQLRSGVVTLLAASTLGVVMLSPAITLYGNFAAAFAGAGRAAPLAFLLALLATLPTATSYALLARDRPAAGSAAAWTQAALGPAIAGWVGLMVVLYYVTNFVLQPVTFGLFFAELCAAFGLHGFSAYALVAALCCAIPAAMVFRGIAPSTHGALAFLVFETVVVVALCASAAVLHPGGSLDARGFLPESAPGGASGLLQGMVFALLSFCGFDVVSTLAEEAKMPRRMIPQATFLSLLSFGALIIGGIWALSFSAPPERLRALAAADGMPITAIARDLWGRGALLVTLTGLSAALGISIATSVGASRILFSMARERLLPAAFARLHPKHRVPWVGLGTVFAVGLAGALAAGALVGPWRAYLWWGTTSTFFAMITFLFVNVSNLILNRARAREGVAALALFVGIPLIGIATDLYLLVESFFVEAWKQGPLGQSAIAFDAACALFCLPLLFTAARAPRPAPPAERR